jgi:hypothetical protein
MRTKEIIETLIWSLYEKGRNFHRLVGIYEDTDKNYRMFNGNQWAGAKMGEIEPIQMNIIKPIVKFKVSVIHDNLYTIVYDSQNYKNKDFRKTAEEYCKLLNRYAARIWERDKMDFKCRRITKDSAINDEGIMYVHFDRDKMTPVNEIVKKNDIYYGNENDDDIQAQPYILIRKRVPVIKAIELAQKEGLGKSKTDLIIGDSDNFEESGEAAKQELDNMVTLVYKFYKQNGTVHYSVATRYLTIAEDTDLGISLYPIAHFNWEEKEGSARGEGEVRYLIPNQIEINRIIMRRALTAKVQAFPRTVVDDSKIQNVSALNTVGAIIKTKGQTVDDVRKVFATIPPAQMSPDVVKLEEDLLNITRDLAGAGDSATGQIDPEDASGRAILAVQQASRAPMTEQKESFKNFVEDLARIWLEYVIAYSADGIMLENPVTDPRTGQESTEFIKVRKVTLEQLQADVKIEISPRSAYDKYAKEQAVENLLTGGYLTAERVGELEIYEKLLDDDSVSPKGKIAEATEHIRDQQKKIAAIKARAQMIAQRADQYLSEGIEAQSRDIGAARRRMVGAAQRTPQRGVGTKQDNIGASV